MAEFSYTARAQNGEVISGSMEAGDTQAVARSLMQQSLIPITINETQGSEQSKHWLKQLNKALQPKVSMDDLSLFARQMFSLTRAGIPLLQAIQGLAGTTTNKRLVDALYDVLAQLERGRTLSASLNRHPKIFNRLFVSIVHVGENTGKLDQAFQQLATYIERDKETQKQIKSATRYPSFVLIAIAIALVIMNYQVIPTFAGMFRKLGADLPLMTKILINMSDFFIHQWYILVGGIVALVFLIKRTLSTESGAMQWDRAKTRLPVVGTIVERSLLARFSRSFSTMLASGIPLTHALDLVADAVNNKYMAKRIEQMRLDIERGENLTRVANKSGLFTPLVMQMISVGDQTGRVDELLVDVAEFYEGDVEYELKTLTARMEPILIGIVAIMVTILALGIFLPMWELMGAYKG